MLDPNVQRKILEKLYEKWQEDFAHHFLLESLPINGVSREALIVNAEYLASKGLIKEPQTMQFWTSITIYGIDQIEDKRISSDIKIRRRILEILKESYEKDPSNMVGSAELVQLTGFSMNEILRSVWYLDQKGFVDAAWALGGLHSAKITANGIDVLREPTELEHELSVMSYAYSILYSLENQLRIFIERKLRNVHGGQWSKCIPEEMVKKAEKLKSEEGDSTLSFLNYMQFGHLSLIIGKNWEIFGETFRDPTGIVSRLSELEAIRHKVAHCRMLSSDELAKLELFRKEIIHMIGRYE